MAVSIEVGGMRKEYEDEIVCQGEREELVKRMIINLTWQ